MEHHILNGDALLAQFPPSIKGEKIVARECLVDGDVKGEDLKGFWQARAAFMENNYEVSKNEYQLKTISEFEKIKHIPIESDVCLWFEYDLFCQVNCWFSVSLIPPGCPAFLVSPGHDDWLGFAVMDTDALENAYHKKQALDEHDRALFTELWRQYQQEDLKALVHTAEILHERFPKLGDTVQAHIDRFPIEQGQGRPERILSNIIHEYGRQHFGTIFKEFSKKAGIYGFGDLQVKRLLDSIPGLLPND